MKALLALFCLLPMLAASEPDRPPTGPDYIFVNGDIYTGLTMSEDLGAAHKETYSRAQALAVKDGRITAVGSNEEIQKLKIKHTRVVDIGGHFVMPGFNDAHTHLAAGGQEKLNVNLVGTRSLAEMQQRIADRAKTAAPGEWIVGGGWDHTLWADQKLPSRQDLDAVTAGHPAVFSRVDGHISVANTAALQQAGITKNTPDPPGGKIDRDANGDPTGIVRESARGELMSKIPKPTAEQRKRGIQLVLQDAAQWGVTSAQDFSDWDDFLVYEELENSGQLTLRITEWLPFNAPLPELQDHRAHHAHTDPMLHTAMLKAFMDGSLGSRTAALLAPYSDDPGNSGLPQYDQEKLNQMARERVEAGFQLGFHAIGDRAVQMALDTFADADRLIREKNLRQPNGSASTDDFRFRVEHAQVTTPDQIERFKQLNVIASMQPCHLLTDMNWAESRLGPERARYSYAWRDFLRNGVHLAFGTDYPVEPITPFRNLYVAITRENEAGTKSYYPDQKLTIDEAIAAYTTGAAYAQYAERDKGTLAPGMLADFVVLDRDITKVSPHDILGTKVLRTVVGGKTVYPVETKKH